MSLSDEFLCSHKGKKVLKVLMVKRPHGPLDQVHWIPEKPD